MRILKILFLLFAVFFSGCATTHKLVDFRVGTKLNNPKNPYYGFKNNEKQFYHEQTVGIWVKLQNFNTPKMIRIYRIYPSGTKILVLQEKVPVTIASIVWYTKICLLAAKEETIILQSEFGGYSKKITIKISPKISPF